VRIAAVRKPDGPTAGAGGIRELTLPDLDAREALRPPRLAEQALPNDTQAGLTYLFQRTTGDDPFRRTHARGSAGAALVRDRLDGETGLARVFSPPAARSWTVDGWVTPGSFAALLEPAFSSSGLFESRPAYRASSAFDGTGQPWIAPWLDGRTAWLRWSTKRPATVTTLRLQPANGVRRPTLVRVNESPPVAVAEDGTVRLPQPIRATEFRLTVLRAAFGPGTPGVIRQRRAVGIAEVRGAGVPTVEITRTGDVDGRCFAAGNVGDQIVRWRLTGSIEDFDAGRPLRVVGCAPVSLPAGETRLEFEGPAPYLVRLRSAGQAPASASPGRVLDAGDADRSGGRSGVELELEAPARLVLAESYNRGRSASCDGEDLGEPEVGAGFGTAWRVPETCRNVTISFAPNRLVTAGYAISAVVGLLLLALLILKRPPPRTEPEPLPEARAKRMRAASAALVAIPAALALGFIFAARATPLFYAGVFLVLWRGIDARQLALAGGAVLTLAVPVLTLLIRPEDRGGYNPEYAIDRIAVHWVAVAGLTLFILALSRAMARPGRARAAPPTAAARPARAP
jgi:hypothetical protein